MVLCVSMSELSITKRFYVYFFSLVCFFLRDLFLVAWDHQALFRALLRARRILLQQQSQEENSKTLVVWGKERSAERRFLFTFPSECFTSFKLDRWMFSITWRETNWLLQILKALFTAHHSTHVFKFFEVFLSSKTKINSRNHRPHQRASYLQS